MAIDQKQYVTQDFQATQSNAAWYDDFVSRLYCERLTSLLLSDLDKISKENDITEFIPHMREMIDTALHQLGNRQLAGAAIYFDDERQTLELFLNAAHPNYGLRQVILGIKGERYTISKVTKTSVEELGLSKKPYKIYHAMEWLLSGCTVG